MSLAAQYSDSGPPNPYPWKVYAQGCAEATNDPCARPGYGGSVGPGGFRNGAASWALGLAAGLVVMEAFASSQLNADENTVTGIINTASAIVFTTGAGVTGEQVSQLRSTFLDLCSVVRQIAYDASLLQFDGRPGQALSTVQIAAITQPAQAAAANNNVVFLALGLLAIFAIVFWA